MSEQHAPSLFTLLVGINDYQYPNIPDLRGCVQDLENVHNFLKQPFMEAKFPGGMHIKALTDQAAKKKAIVQAFHSHLGQAQPGDTALFYFSGHGVREQTTIEAFKEDEFDGNISALVCHDSNPQQHTDPSLACLADKELRYLIRDLAMDKEGNRQLHVVAIFDCCHSGESTRAAIEEPNVRQVERRAFSPRNPEGYFFWNELKDAIASGTPLSQLLPEGKHVHMAACKEVELAQEVPPHAPVRTGVFTSALLNVLTQFEGDINYDDLYTRIINQMPSYTQTVAAQTPQIYLKLKEPYEQYFSFLTHRPGNKSMNCGVIFDPHLRQWKITAGALRGIPIDQEKHPTLVEIFQVGQEQPPFQAKIQEVFPAYSLIRFEGSTPDEASMRHYAKVLGTGIDPLNIFVTGSDEEGVRMTKAFLEKQLAESNRSYYRLVEQEEEANYTFYIQDGVLFTTKPFDHIRPLIMGISLVEDNIYSLPKLEVALRDLEQMANWNFLKKLNYHAGYDVSAFLDRDISMYPVEFRMLLLDGNGEEKRILPNHRTFTFDYPLNFQEDELDKLFRIEILNHSETDYFCSVLYLSNLFGVRTGIMNQPSMLLGPKQQVMNSKGYKHPNGNKYIHMSLKDEAYIKYFNWEYITYFFKLIVSRTAFDVRRLEMKNLPAPSIPDRTGSVETGKGVQRDIFSFEPEAPEVQWEVHTFELNIMNPYFSPQKAT